MKIVVTCGPASEPIDAVRRITNFSTGELGLVLSNRLVRAGHEVVCLKGHGATTPQNLAPGGELGVFTTNDDLASRLRDLPQRENVGAVFHAAALCDFKVGSIQDSLGNPLAASKIPSRQKALTLTLVPASKLLPSLRDLFPNARIVGWKYELEGAREDALAAANRQLRECRTHACVLNGAAYGPGFAFIERDAEPVHFSNRKALANHFAEWLGASDIQADRSESA